MSSDDDLEFEATTQHYAAIGYVAASWAYFEGVIDDWCLRLANIPMGIGVCLTAQIAGSGRKMDAFIALLGVLNINIASPKELDVFAQRAAGMAERRNRMIHDSWDVTDPANPRRLEATARKKLRLLYVSVSTEDLLNFAGQIETLCGDFEVMARNALSALGPSREKSGSFLRRE